MKTITLLLIALFLTLTPANAQVLEVYKDVSVILAGEGDAALEAGDFRVALQKFEQAIVADPGNVSAYIGLGTIYLRIDSLPTSLKYYDLALWLEPTNLTALELQAHAYLSGDSLDQARLNLEKMQTICFDRDCDEEGRLKTTIEDHVEEIADEGENS